MTVARLATIAALCATAALSGSSGAMLAQAQTPVREITRVAGEVYRFRNNDHYSVFAVTPEGVIATDPIDRDAALWLKTEIATRFGKPVKYVIYSHGHSDHATGGEVFSDTATFVSHELTRSTLVRDQVQTPIPPVSETFADRRTVELGGTRVELIYLGPNHGDGMIAMRFPTERVLFAVDFIPVEAIGYRDFPNAVFPDWIESLRKAEALDFDILVPGHGPVGRKAHVQMHREYLEDLREQVLRHVKSGKSLSETQRLVNLTRYMAWGSYAAMRDLNVEGMYRLMTTPR